MNARQTFAELAQWAARWCEELPEKASREFAVIVANGGSHPGELATSPDGKICWTPMGLAWVLGLIEADSDRERKNAVVRLEKWRREGKGPRSIKVGEAINAPIFYPVIDVIGWLEQQRAKRKPDIQLARVDFRRTAITAAAGEMEVA